MRSKVFVFAALLVVLFFAVRFGNSAHAYAASGVAYKTVKWDTKSITVEQYDALLNAQGANGWHLVAGPNDGHPFLVFERAPLEK